MKKISIIYWSGTGNTELMAQSMAEGAKEVHGSGVLEIKCLQVRDASPLDVKEADVVAFGSPAMGVEDIDNTELLPFIKVVKDELKNKAMVLFGSYGWSDHTWIEDWQSDMESYGAKMLADPLAINDTPDQEGVEQCKAYGALIGGPLS